MRGLKAVVVFVLASLCAAAGSAVAQTPASDPSLRLKQVLPADVAARVLAVIARARSRDLPAEALENRALKFAAKGVRADSIEKSVVEHEVRMERTKESLEKARGRRAAADEIEAGADAMRKGLNDADMETLARSATAGRSLAVPLYVVGGLVDRGLNSNAALARVVDRLKARATDTDLERMPTELPPQAAAGQSHKPAETGRAIGQTKQPGAQAGAGRGAGSGGPPSGVPGNGGAKAKPTNPGRGGKPTTPPGKKP